MQKPPRTSGLEPPGVTSFLQSVLRSGLLDQAQLRDSLRTVPAERRTSPESLADHLVKAGKLSRFQSRKLLKGASGGLVLGPYQVLAPIGKGGMSTVYLARDSRNQTLLALKVLPPRRARQEERVLARFLREMEMCRRVSHPHLAWTFEAGVYQGVYYIAMEFIPGKSLYRLVGDQGPLAVSRAARLFAEVALGLEHAHQQGLIHRDMKPSNILITPNDHAKVLDLGLALVQGEIVADHTVVGGQGYVVGTMDYLAPEQSEDASKVDPRSDIYGLGCTLYFALTGQPPFPGGTALQKIMRHRKEEPRPVSELNPAVPPAFCTLLQKMMAKRPERRFSSAAEVQRELQAWVSGEPVLPLDQVGDRGYQKAMAAIETQDVWAELMTEVVPAPPGERARPPRRRPFLVTFFQSIRSPHQGHRPVWLAYLVPLVLAAVLTLGLGLIGLWHLLRH